MGTVGVVAGRDPGHLGQNAEFNARFRMMLCATVVVRVLETHSLAARRSPIERCGFKVWSQPRQPTALQYCHGVGRRTFRLASKCLDRAAALGFGPASKIHVSFAIHALEAKVVCSSLSQLSCEPGRFLRVTVACVPERALGPRTVVRDDERRIGGRSCSGLPPSFGKRLNGAQRNDLRCVRKPIWSVLKRRAFRSAMQ